MSVKWRTSLDWWGILMAVRGVGFVGFLCGCVGVFGSVVAPAWAGEDSPVSVPIVDAVALSPHDRSKREGVKPGSVVLALHAVRRLPKASVVYYSLTVDGSAHGLEEKGIGDDPFIFLVDYLVGRVTQNHYGGDLNGDGAIVDVRHRRMYRPIARGVGCQMCSSNWFNGAPEQTPVGHSRLGWFSTAPVPSDVSRVDVALGNRIFHDVPVGDGPLTPTVDRQTAVQRWSSDGMPLGVGWPLLDPADLSGVNVGEFVSPLVSTTGEVSDARRERVSGGETRIDLSANVLFDKDSDVIKPAGRKIIDRAARELVEHKVSGTVSVIGYTDNLGSASHGLDLSRRRAGAVAKVLGPQLPKGVRLVTDGKGEADPVASNDTEAGRRLNRRVTLTVKGVS
ncbi:OmpA family protein [Streptomyces sp. MAG02]|nr:OmpA family protein [Streptomyces sp. MAG02]